MRHATLAALVLAWVVSGSWRTLSERVAHCCALWTNPRARNAGVVAVAAATSVLLALGMQVMAETRTLPYFKFDGCVYAAYPVEACDYLIRTKPPGPMLAGDVNYAGYLIWRLSPEHYTVWSDSRFDIHGSGPARMISSLKAASDDFTVDLAREGGNPILGPAPDDQPYWRAILEWVDPGFIVVSTDVERFHILDRRLSEQDSGWARVFVSPARHVAFHPDYPPWTTRGYAIYVRNTAENAQRIERLRKAWLEERESWH